MAEYYTHYLIPVPSDVAPSPDQVTHFLGQMITDSHVALPVSISLIAIAKAKKKRQGVNPFTRQVEQAATRRPRKPQTLSRIDELLNYVAELDEYDVSVNSNGMPPNEPLAIGFIADNGSWERMREPYELEIRFRVRSTTVGLSKISTDQPPGSSSVPADFMFDEDCSTDEVDGVFWHPEAGEIRVPNAGCAMFWVEFNFGRWVHPNAPDGSVDLLDEAIVKASRRHFGIDFVQACNWG
jgi:hypothetical protein